MEERKSMITLQKIVLLSVIIGISTWFVYVSFWMPRLSLARGMFYVPTPICAAFLSMILGVAISTLLVLFAVNRHRIRSVLKPNRGRLIVAAFLGFTMHLWNAEFIPIVPIGIALTVLTESVAWFLFFIGLGALLSVLWYIPACLIVSGVSSKAWRVAIVALFWWGTASCCMLIFGVTDFI